MLLLFSVVTPSATASKDYFVTVEEASQLAQSFIDLESIYGVSDVVYYSNVYDIDDSVLGYYFDIIKEKQTVGYILISATKKRPPILEFGENQMNDMYKKAVNENLKVYYLNAMNQISALNSADLQRKFYEAKNNKIEALKKSMTNADEEKSLELADQLIDTQEHDLTSMKTGNYELYWDNLYSDNSSIYAVAQRELSVPRIWQRTSGVTWEDSACGPATGAMISNYFKNQEYSIRNSSYYGGDAQFINHLWGEMSFVWGTSAGSFRDNMKSHLNKNYSTSPIFSAITWSSGNSYYNIKDDINRNIPFGIRFESNNRSETGAYGDYHWVAGIGYQTTAGGEYVGIKDPDSGQYNTGTHWINWEINRPYTETVHFSIY